METLRLIFAVLFMSHSFQLLLIKKMNEEVFGEIYAWILVVISISAVVYITVQIRKKLKGELNDSAH